MRKPYFLKRLRCWYVKTSSGKSIRLDPDKAKAFAKWHDLASQLEHRGPLATWTGLANAFLEEHRGEMSAARFDDLERYAASFALHYSGLVSKLTKKLVYDWLDAPKRGRRRKDDDEGNAVFGPDRTWSESAKRDAGAAIKRILRWAHGEGLISRNPLHSLKLPEPQPRKILIDQDTHAKMVQDCMGQERKGDRSFALYLIASHCGARPQQIREIAAANVVPGAWVFHSHKTAKKTGKPLVVYLSPCLQTLTAILSARHTQGPLFRNGQGAWKKDTVSQRIRRIRKRLDLPDGVIAYAYRHTFATTALGAGIPIATVAHLLGHQDSRMVSKVYGHLDQLPAHMIEAAARVSQKRLTDE